MNTGLKLLLGHTILDELAYLLVDRLDEFVSIRGVGDRIDAQRCEFVDRVGSQHATDAVGKAFLLADSIPEPRGEGASAEHEIAHEQGGIAWIIIPHGVLLGCKIHRIGLVGSFDRFDRLLQIERRSDRSALVRNIRFPIAEDSRKFFLHLGRVEIPDDGNFTLTPRKEVSVKGLDFFEFEGFDVLELFFDGRIVADVSALVWVQRTGHVPHR